MAFQSQTLPALFGVANYEVFSQPVYIGLPRINRLTHNNRHGVIPPMTTHRDSANLPSHPSFLYEGAPPDPEAGYHVWSGVEATIANGRILPNPPRERGAIIGRVQHNNHGDGVYLNGRDSDASARMGVYPRMAIEDPVNAWGSTLGYPDIPKFSAPPQVFFSGSH